MMVLRPAEGERPEEGRALHEATGIGETVFHSWRNGIGEWIAP